LSCTTEQIILEKIYRKRKQKKTFFVGHQHKILPIATDGSDAALLILPRSHNFLKKDWEAMGRKLGFIPGRDSEKIPEKEMSWFDVLNIHHQPKSHMCSFTCDTQK